MHNYKPEQISVMILAAGQGKRMLPLTENTAKPLLKVGDYSLIEHHLIRLQRAGFKQVIINVAHQAEQITQALGDGERYSLEIRYSDESASGALETAGGIHHALPLIDSDPFLVINGDVWTDFPFQSLLKPLHYRGRLVVITNPEHNPDGDFCIGQNELLLAKSKGQRSVTFSGLALYQKPLFEYLSAGRQALAPVLHKAIKNNQLQALLHQGVWVDVGTPERLAKLSKQISSG